MLPTAQSFGAHLGTIGSAKDEEGPNPWFVPTSFEVRAETQWGETVVVVGSAAALGSWNPAHGLRMTTNAGQYPVWRCDPLLLCADELEFKFAANASELPSCKRRGRS